MIALTKNSLGIRKSIVKKTFAILFFFFENTCFLGTKITITNVSDATMASPNLDQFNLVAACINLGFLCQLWLNTVLSQF